jgi:hypothetical protein
MRQGITEEQVLACATIESVETARRLARRDVHLIIEQWYSIVRYRELVFRRRQELEERARMNGAAGRHGIQNLQASYEEIEHQLSLLQEQVFDEAARLRGDPIPSDAPLSDLQDDCAWRELQLSILTYTVNAAIRRHSF